MKKTALILSGGGMRGIFTVGALMALKERLGMNSFDIVIAGSAGAVVLHRILSQNNLKT